MEYSISGDIRITVYARNIEEAEEAIDDVLRTLDESIDVDLRGDIEEIGIDYDAILDERRLHE